MDTIPDPTQLSMKDAILDPEQLSVKNTISNPLPPPGVVRLEKENTTQRTVGPLNALRWLFILEGIQVGCGYAAITPAVAIERKLSNGTLGAVLLAGVGGAIASAPVVSYIIWKHGSKVAVGMGSFGYVGLPIIIGIPGDIGILILGIICQGFTFGALLCMGCSDDSCVLRSLMQRLCICLCIFCLPFPQDFWTRAFATK
jgi:hypothetical protein